MSAAAGLSITAADAADSEAICALLESAGLPASDLKCGAQPLFLVARQGQRLCGAVGLDLFGADALLRSLVVSADRRGAGLGAELVEAAERLAAAQGVRTLYLLTNTAQEYFAARSYRAVERAAAPPQIEQHPQFRSLCPSTAVFMSKRL